MTQELNETDYRLTIINTLHDVYSAMHMAVSAIRSDDKLVAWSTIPSFSDLRATTPREQIIRVIEQLEYLNEQEPREIIVAPGLLGASAKTISLIHHLNEAKKNFKHAVVAFKQAKLALDHPEIQNSVEALLNKRHPRTAHSLKKYGFARLHLKQCYRQIPILETVPQKVSWTWANTRSIKRVTVLEADTMLRRRGQDYGIEQQLIKLHQLPKDEHIAIVQELAPHLRTNIVISKGAELERFMLKGSLPLVFPADSSTALPEYKAPKEKSVTDPGREKRNDQQLDPTPFLPAIRGYRYVRMALLENDKVD